MLVIDGKVLNLASSNTKDATEFEKYCINNWNTIKKEYNIAANPLPLRLRKTYIGQGLSTDEKGKNERKVPQRPNSISIPLSVDLYDANGDPHHVIYAERSRKNKDNEIEYEPHYKRIKKDLKLTLNDKELILFLLLFSDSVEGEGSSSMKFTYPSKRKKYFYFENVVANAKQKFTDREKSFEIFNSIKSMGVNNLKRFANTIGLPTEGIIPDTLREDVIVRVENNESEYEALKVFLETHDNKIYDIEYKVNNLIQKGKINYSTSKTK